MSVGSWMSLGTEDIGTRPDYMGPWEKLQLGWLDYSVVNPGESNTFRLDPSAAVVVDIGDVPVPKTYVDLAGGHAWWTGNADDLISTLTRTVDLTGLSSATVTASAFYNIEAGYDYLYFDYSTDGGSTWTTVGDGLDGSSNGRWTTLRYTIPGAANAIRFRYDSDSGTNLGGAFLDDVVVKSGGTTLFTDDVESGVNGWTAAGGFKISTGTEESVGDRYYLAENRTYVGYDAGLEVGPYQFSFALTDPDKVEHFAFEDGLLVWLVDESYSDNDNSQHTGHGLALPVDARPAPFAYPDGTRPSNRRQPFDATFGKQAVPAGPTADPEGGTLPCAGLHKQYLGGTKQVPVLGYYCAWPTAAQRAAIPMFDDTVANLYWTAANAQNSVKTPGSGVTMEVTGQRTGSTLTVEVVNPAP
jgi:immune inhibitor A